MLTLKHFQNFTTMKKTLRIIATLMVFATTVAGCTKTEDTANEAVQQGEATLARIMDFKQQMEEAKANPAMKSTTYMSIADAVWNVEALFNLTYAYPVANYGTTVTRDTTLYLTVCSNDSVLVNDLSTFYGQMMNAVQAICQSVDLDDKQFLILDVEAGERHGSEQAIGLHTVQGNLKGTPPVPSDSLQPWRGPFTNSPAWYYGANGGNNQGIEPIECDAADTLSGMLNAILVAHAPENYEYIYTGIMTKQSNGCQQYTFSHDWFPNISPDYCEFYKENPAAGDYWLDADLLNFHYYGETHLILDILPNELPHAVPADKSLFKIVIEDRNSTDPERIWHHTYTYYGNRFIVWHGTVPKGNL